MGTALNSPPPKADMAMVKHVSAPDHHQAWRQGSKLLPPRRISNASGAPGGPFPLRRP